MNTSKRLTKERVAWSKEEERNWIVNAMTGDVGYCWRLETFPFGKYSGALYFDAGD